MSLLLMPDEILATVFGNLSKHALAMSAYVCRRLHTLAVEALYRDIAFQSLSYHSEGHASPRDVFKFCDLLRTLATKPSLTFLMRSFYLQAWHVTRFFTPSLVISQKSLEFPSLTSLEFEYGSMTLENLSDVLQRTPMLRYLHCKFNLNYQDDGSFVKHFDLELLGHALKHVSNTIEELAITMSRSYEERPEEHDAWDIRYREYHPIGHLGSVLRDCVHLNRLTTQISILLGENHSTKVSLLDVLPLNLLQLRIVDPSKRFSGGEWPDSMLVDKLFDYLRDGAIKAGLKHLFVHVQASEVVDLQDVRHNLGYDEDDWEKLKRLVLSNKYDFSYDQNIVSINTQEDPCEQLICEICSP